MPQDIRGKVALVTGAGRGVGAAVALALAARGARVGLLARNEQELAAVRGRVEESGGTALSLVADVRDEGAVNAAVTRLSDAFGPVQILVNSAGHTAVAPIDDLPAVDWRAVLETNLTGPYLCTRAVLPGMKQTGQGWVISIGSRLSRVGDAGQTAYAASKHGLIGFMQSLAVEVRPHGIKVATICPGDINTRFGRAEGEIVEGAVEPIDVANTVMFLIDQSATAWTEEINLWPFALADSG